MKINLPTQIFNLISPSARRHSTGFFERARGAFFLFPFTLFLFTFFSCQTNKTPVSPVKPEINLTVEDVLVTEAWLKVQVERVTENRHISLWRDSTEVYNGVLKTTDTTLYDSGLLPNRNYSYTAYLWRGEEEAAHSKSAKAHTMDTTSHNFTWEITEFGGVHGSSVLYDVAIVNENNIWAVGEIHTAETDTFDSTGNWVPPYNAVHWDGSEWELVRFMVPGPGYSEIYSVLAFGPNDVWMGQGSARHWDGQEWNIYNSNNGFPGAFRVRKIWGTSSSNLYFVGDGGNIVHYDGQRWTRLRSGTELPIQDIWGAKNEKNGEIEIVCVASNKYLNEGKKILKINGFNVTALPDSGLPWSLSTIWFIPRQIYYICGDGVFTAGNLNGNWTGQTGHPLLYKHAIKGQVINDVFIAGSFGLLSHFNGYNWKHYTDNGLPTAAYRSVDIRENLIVAVGYYGRAGFLAVGRRN